MEEPAASGPLRLPGKETYFSVLLSVAGLLLLVAVTIWLVTYARMPQETLLMVLPASLLAVLTEYVATRKRTAGVRAVMLGAAIAALTFLLVLCLGTSVLVCEELSAVPAYFFECVLYSIALSGQPVPVFVLMGVLGAALVRVRHGRRRTVGGRYPAIQFGHAPVRGEPSGEEWAQDFRKVILEHATK